MTQFIQASKAAALACGLLAAAGAAGPAAAQDGPGRADALERLVACRAIGDAGQRLACYDQAAEALDQAERAGEVVVLDRAQVEQTRRGLFGFAIPDIDLFNRGGQTAEEIDDVPYVIRSARGSGRTDWMFEMEDGSVWRQIDGMMWSRPRPGDTAVVSRAALGSYMLRVGDSRPVRVRRER